jgi:hypothetical protein
MTLDVIFILSFGVCPKLIYVIMTWIHTSIWLFDLLLCNIIQIPAIHYRTII